jgi:hypothetical protein
MSSSQNEICFRQKLSRKSEHTFCVQQRFRLNLRRLWNNVGGGKKTWWSQRGDRWQYNTEHNCPCWITKATHTHTHTHSKYVILIVPPRQQSFRYVYWLSSFNIKLVWYTGWSKSLCAPEDGHHRIHSECGPCYSEHGLREHSSERL